jgi:hypothetical protein
MLGANQASAGLTHFFVESTQSQFSGNLSLNGQIIASSDDDSESKTVSDTGTFVGPVVGIVDANVDTSGGTFSFQDIALSSSIGGSLSTSTTFKRVSNLPVTVNVVVTNATVGIDLPSSSSSLTYTGSGGVYSWGPTAMTLKISVDYTATLSMSGNPRSISDTASFSVPLASATGTVTLDGVGNPIAYALGIPGVVIPIDLTTSSDGDTANFTGNLTLNNLNLNLQGASTVVPPPSVPEVPVPAAVYLFISGLLVLIGIARRRKST